MKGSVPTPERLLKQMIAVEKNYLEKVWEDISTNREYIYTLKTIAESGENIYKKLKPKKINVVRAIKNLEEWVCYLVPLRKRTKFIKIQKTQTGLIVFS